MPVVAVNCLELSEEEIKNILQKVLYQFPVKEIKVDMPQWLCSLEKNIGCVLRYLLLSSNRQVIFVG